MINSQSDEVEDWDEYEDDAEYESPLDAVVDQCNGAKLFDQLADFAPPHVALKFIAHEAEAETGCALECAETRQLFLEAARVVYSDASIMEHNSLIACYHCDVEVEPVVDEKLIQQFLDLQARRICITDFYRCPGCGGEINAVNTIRDPDRHLPWFHYEHDFDFGSGEHPER